MPQSTTRGRPTLSRTTPLFPTVRTHHAYLLNAKMHCVWLYSGTPSYTPTSPEDVKPGSENLLLWPSKKGGSNCPLFRDTAGNGS
eukprot:2229586-Pyramimonas_sp.AAC.1